MGNDRHISSPAIAKAAHVPICTAGRESYAARCIRTVIGKNSHMKQYCRASGDATVIRQNRIPTSSAFDRRVVRERGGITTMYPSPIASDIASTSQFAVLKSRSIRFMYCGGLAGLSWL